MNKLLSDYKGLTGRFMLAMGIFLAVCSGAVPDGGQFFTLLFLSITMNTAGAVMMANDARMGLLRDLHGNDHSVQDHTKDT